MIVDRLQSTDRYAAVHPGLGAALSALRRADLASFGDGRQEIDGERLFVLIARTAGRGPEVSPLEAHRRYIDVQYVLSGRDVIGWLPKAQCRRPRGDYDAARDILFFDDRPASWITLEPGMLAVFFPDDAHAPLSGEGPVHKVVVKLAADWAGPKIK